MISKSAINFLDKFKNKDIVFTNGCFDILHRGHVEYLTRARGLGDALFIGLNSDRSVKELKGELRPINKENDRRFILAALRCVDFVEVFDDANPLELIKFVRPKYLVKGGDWEEGKIVGADFVHSIGGVVKSLSFVEGHSTTSIIHSLNEF